MKTFTPRVLALLIIAVFSQGLLNCPAGAADPELHHDYALELIRRGEHEKALEQLQKAYQLYSADPTLKKNLATAYTLVGKRLIEHNRFDEAAEKFEQARELYPDEPSYSKLRGIALYLGKRYDSAIVEFERARGLSGDSAELLYYLGRVYYDTGETAHSVELWEKGLAIDPANRNLQEVLAKGRRELVAEAVMDKEHSGRFLVSYDVELKTELADQVLDVLESAYNAVGSDLGYFPTARVPVILYTKKEYKSITASPDWSGGLYDGKIRLPIGGITEIPPRLRGVLRHEYTHVVINELTKGNCPTWLNEGIAEVEGRKEFDSPLTELDKAAKSGALLPVKSLEDSFASLGGKEATVAYQQSYSLVRFMVATYGWYKVREILVNLGDGMPVNAAVAKAFADFGLTYNDVEGEWRAHLLKESGGL